MLAVPLMARLGGAVHCFGRGAFILPLRPVPVLGTRANRAESRGSMSVFPSTCARIPPATIGRRGFSDFRSEAISTFCSTVLDVAVGTAGVVAKIYLSMLFVVWFFQRRLLFLPPLDVVDPTVIGGDLVLVEGSSQEQLAALYFRPPDEQAPVLVFFHGNADQLGWTPAYLGRHFADQNGLGFFGVEYPGYGQSEGSPSEKSIHVASELLLRYLVEHIGIAENRLVLVGHSVGCGAAMEMARKGHGGKLILVSPFLSVPDMAAVLYPIFAWAVKIVPILASDPFDNASKASSIKVPTLVIHGQQDGIVPFKQGEALARRIRGAQLDPLPRVGHNDVFDDVRVLNRIAQFARAGN